MATADPLDLGYLRSLGLPFAPSVAANLMLSTQAAPTALASTAPAARVETPAAQTSKAPAAKVEKPPAKQAAADGAKVAAKAAAPAPAKAPATSTSSHPPPTGVTEHVFLTDTSLVKLDGCKLLTAATSSDLPKDAPEGVVKLTVVLARTIFHPQGGGQPADTGKLIAEGLQELPVSFTSCRKEDSAILHDCLVAPAIAEAWVKAAGTKQVSCHLDAERRRLCAAIHSAGHLLDAAVSAVQPPLKWVPGKGYHFADGPYVEYVLNDESRKIDMKKPAEKDKVVNEIQANIDRLVSNGGKVNIQYKEGVRHVEMAGEECPCGGTHVQDLKDIGKVEVKKMAAKQGNIRLSYVVAAAA